MSWYTHDPDFEAAREAHFRSRAGYVIGQQEQRMADELAHEEDPGFVSAALDQMGDIGAGVAHGAAGAVDETVQFLGDVADLTGILKPTGGGEWGDVTATRDLLSKVVDAPDTIVGQGAAGIAQFITGWMLPGGAVAKAGKLAVKGAQKVARPAVEKAAQAAGGTAGQVAGAMGKGAVADAVAFDPFEARLSTMLNEVPWLEPVVNDWLASNDPSQSSWEGRLKNATEGMVLGTVMEGLLRSPQMYKAMRRAWAHRQAGRPEMAEQSAQASALQDKAKTAAVETVQDAEDGVTAASEEVAAGLRTELEMDAPMGVEEWAGMPAFAREEMRGQTSRQMREGMRRYRDDTGELTIEGKLQASRRAEMERRGTLETREGGKVKVAPEELERLPGEVQDIAVLGAAKGHDIPLESLQKMGKLAAGRVPQVTARDIEELPEALQEYALDRMAAGEIPQRDELMAQGEVVREAEEAVPSAGWEADLSPEGARRVEELRTELRGLDDDDYEEIGRISGEISRIEDEVKVARLPEEAQARVREIDEERGRIEETDDWEADEELFDREAALARERITLVEGRPPEDLPPPELPFEMRYEAAREAVAAMPRASFRESVAGKTIGDELAQIAEGADQPPGFFATRDAKVTEEVTEGRGIGGILDSEGDWLFGLAREGGLMGSKDVDLAFRRLQWRKEEYRAVESPQRRAAYEKALLRFRKSVVKASERYEVQPKPLEGVEASVPGHYRDYSRRKAIHERHEPGMGRSPFAARRGARVSELEEEMPKDVVEGEAELRDRAMRLSRPELLRGAQSDEAYRSGSSQGEGVADRPVEVFLEDATQVEDFEALTASVSKELKGEVRGGSHDDARRSIQALLDDTTDWRAEEMVAFRPRVAEGVDAGEVLDTIHAMAGSLRTMASFVAGPGTRGTPADLASFVRGVMKYDAYLRWASGQVDESRRIMEMARGGDDAVHGLGERMWAHRFLDENGRLQSLALANAVLKTNGDLARITRVATEYRSQNLKGWQRGKQMGARFVSKPVREIWVNSVLSSPATHMRNIIGNTMVPLIRLPEHFIAGFMEGGLSQARGETMAAMQGMVAGFKDGVFLLNNDFRTAMANMAGDADRAAALREMRIDRGMDAMHAEFAMKIKADDISNAKATGMPSFLMEAAGRHPWGGKVAQVMDVRTRQAINTPLAALQSEDMFFKALTYRMEVQRRAFLQHWRTGLRGDALDEAVAKSVRRPDKDIHMAAMRQSHVNTFTNDLGKAGQWSLDTLNAIPGARYVVPFFKTPANIATMAGRYIPFLERTPGLGLLYKAEREALAQGGRAAQEIQARRIVGGGILLGGFGLVMSGRMTGGEVTNPQFRSTGRALGRPEYSVKIGGTWYDYRRWAGPWGLSLAATADAFTLLSAADTQEEYDVAAAFFQSASNMVGGIMDETWLGNVGEFMEVVAGDHRQQAAERFIASTARGMVPLSALSDDVREMFHLAAGAGRRQEWRQAGGAGGSDETLIEQMGEMLRGAGKQMFSAYRWIGEDGRKYPVLDLYGEPLTAGEGPVEGLGFMAALSPVAHVQERTDPLSKAIADLRMPIDRPRRTIQVSGPAMTAATLELDPDQYQFYAKRVGQLFKQIGTQKVSRARFRNYPSDALRMADIKVARGQAVKRARRELLVRFPTLRLDVQQTRMRLRREMMGER